MPASRLAAHAAAVARAFLQSSSVHEEVGMAEAAGHHGRRSDRFDRAVYCSFQKQTSYRVEGVRSRAAACGAHLLSQKLPTAAASAAAMNRKGIDDRRFPVLLVPHPPEPPGHINSVSPFGEKSPMHPLSFQPSMFTSNAFFSSSFHVLSRPCPGGGVYPKHAHLSQ